MAATVAGRVREVMREAESAVEEIRGRTQSEATELRAEAERRADSLTQRRLDEIHVLRNGLVGQTEALAQGFNQLVSALASAADTLAQAAGEPAAPKPPPGRRVRLTVSERREISVTLEHESTGQAVPDPYVPAAGRPVEAPGPGQPLAPPPPGSEPGETAAEEARGEPRRTDWRRLLGPLAGRWRRRRTRL